MAKIIQVTAKTPDSNTKDYMFMGDLNNTEDQQRFIDFIDFCRKIVTIQKNDINLYLKLLKIREYE